MHVNFIQIPIHKIRRDQRHKQFLQEKNMIRESKFGGNLNLDVEVDRSCYEAGSIVKGNVCINTQNTGPYSELKICLEGEEFVKWETPKSTGLQGEDIKVHSNNYKNYFSEFILFDFRGVIRPGHYSFPFTFLLPMAMSGSFDQKNCHIHYNLTATLTHVSELQYSKTYKIFINIQEPLRAQLGVIKGEKTVNTAACCFCWSENVTIKLQCDKKVIKNEEPFKIKGQIHNNSTTEIERAQVSLVEKSVMVFSNNAVYTNIENKYVLKDRNAIKALHYDKFQFQATLPESIRSYTAIGKIAALYFVLKAQFDMGCCFCCTDVVPFVQIHVIVQNSRPKVLMNRNFQRPQDWNPVQMPLREYMEMRPFIYEPSRGIKYRNQQQIRPQNLAVEQSSRSQINLAQNFHEE